MSFPVNPNHNPTRDFFRLLGPILLAVGGLLTLIGFVSFFSAFGGGGMPQYFWCAFVGMPLLGAGAFLCKLGYLGAMTRYMAGEVAPVGKDVVNYMAHETKGSVKNVATAMAEGLRNGFLGAEESPLQCPTCHARNDRDARFCKQCGIVLDDKVLCAHCGKSCGCGARFCSDCGKAVA